MNRRTTISICLTVVMSIGVAMLWAEEKPASKTASMQSIVENTALELWRSNIKPPAGKENSSELAEALRRLESMRFREKADLFPNAEASSKQPTSRPASQPSQTKTDQPARINPEMLAKLKQLPPGSVTEPATLADTLFLGGYLESAAFFYEMAQKNETDADEKAWLLFQTANCYREANPEEALKTYAKLLSEYPNSLWSSAAYMPKSIIEWNKANKMDDLLKELEKQSRPSALRLRLEEKDTEPTVARKIIECK